MMRRPWRSAAPRRASSQLIRLGGRMVPLIEEEDRRSMTTTEAFWRQLETEAVFAEAFREAFGRP